MTYYIDLNHGCAEADGLSPETARLTYTDLELKPGDRVLFKRGTFVRDSLYRKSGTPDAYITYGAYGEGANPVFCGSADVSDPADWEEIRPNVWKYRKSLGDEACNFIFDGGRTGGTLRWEEGDLSRQGDWHDTRIGSREQHTEAAEEKLLLFSKGNPGEVYSHIECAVWGRRNLSANTDCTAVEDLCFFGSGVHVLSGGARHMTVRRCSFGFIGGAVWNRQLRIRFGNAIEFWNYGEDILIEDCYFNNIYDSAITQQGGGECEPAKKLVMRNNLFVNYGMGAYEGRDVMPVDCAFTGNLCLYAGGGFSAFGDTLPRNSEIYPQPMGHHLFFWRIPKATDGGGFTVSDNRFYEASGAALYAIIAPEADAQMHLKNNRYYTSNRKLLNRRADEWFSADELEKTRDEGAVWDESDLTAPLDEWFEKSGADRMGMPVFTDVPPSPVYFEGSTEKDALSYAAGEDMCFRLSLKRGGMTLPLYTSNCPGILPAQPKTGAPAPSCAKFRWEIEADDGSRSSGEADGTSGQIELHASCSVPGYVHVKVIPCGADGRQLEGYDIFEGGACADFEKIRQAGAEPADFDEFWEKTIREELDPVAPVLLEKIFFNCGDPGDIVFDVKIACPGRNPVSGYVRIPRDAEPGSLPIHVSYMGYGVSSAPIPTKERSIRLAINQHGDDNGHPVSYYAELGQKVYGGFGFDRKENADPATVYFKYMILRAVQAIRWCKTLPLWDGKNVKVSGGSMGAFQSVSAAAWGGATEAEIAVPWMCDLQGIAEGKLGGWRPAIDPGILYYDTASQAKRVKCPVTITAGLGDYVCPPSGVTALAHNFAGPVKLVMLQNKTHPYTAPTCSSCERLLNGR